MPEIEFTIDPVTGQLTSHIQGISGPACERVADVLKQLMGGPSAQRETAEYRARVAQQQKVQGT